MSDLIFFNFDGIQVRTIEQDGDVWFVAVDVAKALGYAKPHEAISKHCKRVTQFAQIVDAPKQGVVDPKTGLVPESDIYRLVMKSRLPAAERFEEWVVGEVLPTLRKTGSYEVQPREPASALDAVEGMVKAMRHFEAEQRIQSNRIGHFEVEQHIQSNRIGHVEERMAQIAGPESYMTVQQYYRECLGHNISTQEASPIGRQLSAYCRQKGVEMGKQPVPGSHYPPINTYPKWLMDSYFENA